MVIGLGSMTGAGVSGCVLRVATLLVPSVAAGLIIFAAGLAGRLAALRLRARARPR